MHFMMMMMMMMMCCRGRADDVIVVEECFGVRAKVCGVVNRNPLRCVALLFCTAVSHCHLREAQHHIHSE